jgi:two-component system chemotaxis response regulator CheY
MHALVVDDSRAIRLILRRFLQEIGFEVAEAGNGIEALEALTDLYETADPALCLVDWNMPEMNGIEFVGAVRAKAEWAGIRLVMVTTENEMSQVVRALEAGADEYVMKPFTKEVIIDKLSLLGLVHAS